MPPSPLQTVAAVLIGVALSSLGCSSRSVVLDPPDLFVDEWRDREITVRGLVPSDFLDVRGSTLEPVADLSISLSLDGTPVDVETLSLDVAGPMFKLASRPTIGTHDARVHARGRTYATSLVVKQRRPSLDGGADALPDSDAVSDGAVDASIDAEAQADVDNVIDADELVDGDADGDTDAPVDGGCRDGDASCEGDLLSRCVDGVWTFLPCPLGCVDGEGRCTELVPSNVMGPPVTGGALLDFSEDVTFDTETGRIDSLSGDVVRPPGEGMLSDISFERQDNGCLGVGVFGMGGFWLREGAVLRTRSERGLLIVVDGEVIVDGLLIVSAIALEPGSGGYRGGERGEPGFGPGGGGEGEFWTDCCDSGSGGGGHAGLGGRGGNAQEARGGARGSATGNAEVVPLCGGSGGGGHWGPTWPTRGSEGGAGGGAVQVSASTSLSVSDTGGILAGGGGGTGGHPSGGGGGGAGGAILLEAPTVEVAGRLGTAGGGGGSGGHPDGLPGNDGDDGGDGGASTGTGAPGGDGGGSLVAGSAGGDHSNNGGGGGGAAGRIRINTRDGTPVVTGPVLPAATTGVVSTR